jgi:hypothetical protein
MEIKDFIGKVVINAKTKERYILTKVLEVEGADHKFTGMLDEFISLTDML